MELIIIALILLGLRAVWGWIYSERVLTNVRNKCDDNPDDYQYGWHWRYEELQKVDIIKVCLCFWRTPKSFFEETKLERELL